MKTQPTVQVQYKRCRNALPGLMSTYLLFLAIVALPLSGFAKMYEEPRSFSLNDRSQDQVRRKILPKIDAERLAAEDRERGKNPQKPAPYQFAVAANVDFTLENSGTWQTLADGRLWRLRIQSPGAKSLNLGITRFDIREGAKLWIYDPDHKQVEGPYTARNRSHLGSLWTPVIQGEEMVVEVFVPTGIATPVIEIRKANQGYRGFEKGIPGAGTEGACEIDVVCPQGNPWQSQIRAVGVYTKNGTATCTGTLLNDTAHDLKPYFLSANHCGVDSVSDATVVVYWNYQSATCGTHGPGSLADNQSGSIFRASFAPSDFLLLELSTMPNSSFNVFHAGWDASGTIPPATVGIHHPAADVKAISFANTPPDTTAYGSSTHDPLGNHWRVLWNSGVTEPGSSGSGLFDTTNGRCIGQLHGGPSACGGADLHDYYGRFSVSWDGGGTAATRLRDWLDPGNTGAIAMDGDPHITTINGAHYDFQGSGEFVSLRDPDGLEIQTRQAAIATTFNPGPDAHDGLATCVSLNTAVAARVGKHRVTYEPNLSGVPDPSGLQLRIDGTLTTLNPTGNDLGDGGRISNTPTPGGLEVDFPDGTIMFVTPGWWASQGKWYLNVDVYRQPKVNGTSADAAGNFATGGIAGAIASGNWLPALPDGTSMGPMPSLLHDRYIALYQKFADAWRVTAKTSLFDYAAGTSTDTFTLRSWPLEHGPCVVPDNPPVKPLTRSVAQEVCRPISDKNRNANCVFDVMVTGERGFAKTYLFSQRIELGATTTTVSDNKNPSTPEEPVVFTATVRPIRTPIARELRDKAALTGSIQFILDGSKVGIPIKLNSKGQASWKTSELKPGEHRIAAEYLPSKGSAFLPSTGPDEIHTIGR